MKKPTGIIVLFLTVLLISSCQPTNNPLPDKLSIIEETHDAIYHSGQETITVRACLFGTIGQSTVDLTWEAEGSQNYTETIRETKPFTNDLTSIQPQTLTLQDITKNSSLTTEKNCYTTTFQDVPQEPKYTVNLRALTQTEAETSTVTLTPAHSPITNPSNEVNTTNDPTNNNTIYTDSDGDYSDEEVANNTTKPPHKKWPDIPWADNKDRVFLQESKDQVQQTQQNEQGQNTEPQQPTSEPSSEDEQERSSTSSEPPKNQGSLPIIPAVITSGIVLIATITYYHYKN